MSIESKMKAVIENRSRNFYSMFDEFMAEDEYYFTHPNDPSFDFEAGSDEERNYKTTVARFNAIRTAIQSNAHLYYTDDESSEYFGYTYDEIIGMANNGASIPDEVLTWAYEMADQNPATDSSETQNSSAHDLYLSLKNNPSLNIKTIAKIFVKECKTQKDELEAYLEEIDPISNELETSNAKTETIREQALNEIKSLTEEKKSLETKLESGEELSDSEKQRFKEIQGLFADADKRYQKNIDVITKNFTDIKQLLNNTNQKADIHLDFGIETADIAYELAEFEKTQKRGGLLNPLLSYALAIHFDMGDLIGTKRFSQLAQTVGLNTQIFAKDIMTTVVDTQALMQKTANTARFDLEDPSYTVESLTNDEDISEPSVKRNAKTTTGEVSDEEDSPEVETQTVETPQEEPDEAPVETDPSNTEGTGVNEVSDEAADDAEDKEPTDEEMLTEGESKLEDVNAKSLSLPKLKRLIKEEGVDSEKKGKDALKLVEQLKSQSAKVDEKEEKVQEDTQEVKEASEAEPEEGTEGTGNEGAVEEAQAGAEESQDDLTAATEDEALTVKGLRETFKASTKANKKYSKDVDEANKKMKESIYTGAFTIAGGGYMTGVGIFNVVTGTSLLASSGWWNPFIAAVATYMINIGAMEIGLGATMIAGGTALTVSATDGLEINKEADEKIGISGEDITTASESLNEIEREQAQEVEGEDGEKENPDETEDTEEPTEDDKLNQDKSLLGKMYTGNDELPPKRSLVIADGKKSSAIGKENVAKLIGLERQIPSLIEATIEMEQAKQEQAAQTADPESAGVASNVQDPAEVYEEYRQDYKTDLETNKGFQQDIKETKDNAQTNLGYATLGTAAGTARTTLGASEIAIGTILAAQWWNPVAMMLGLALIKKGIEDTALGTEMLAVGMALTVNSTTTLAAGAIASNQVSESNEKTNKSLETVDAIEAEINSAVQEQLAANGEQDLSGMSTIDLLTLIINNGIQSSNLGAENTEILEQLRAQLPKLLENAQAKSTEETDPEAETTEVVEDSTQDDENSENEEKENDKDTFFTKYKNDFKTDLETNERYSGEIKQARNMSPILRTSFFLGAPVEKASNKIEISNEQTSAALEETEKMEEQLKKVQEEKAKAEEIKEQENPEDKLPEEAETSPEDTVADAASEEEEAADAVKEDEKEVKKNDKAEKKEEKKEKKEAKTQKTQEKNIKQAKKGIVKSEQEAQENEKEALQQLAQGEEVQNNSNQDEAQANAEQTTNEMSEAENISGEVEGLVAEVEANVAETQSAIAAATAENQGIVTEMNAINMELQQDKTKMKGFENQLKQQNKKSSSQGSAQKQPEQPKEEPQPVAQPKKAAKATAPKKQAKVEEEKPEEPNNKPAGQQPAPVQKRAVQEPQEVEAPEGADKIEFASDKEKQPDFVGFVAQSDSLASGSVLVGTKAKTTTNNAQGNNNGNSNQNKGNIFALKNKQKQAKAAKEQQAAEVAQDNAEQPQTQIKAAKRTTPKPFDISQMQGGNGDGKTQQIRTSMEAVRTAAFNKQARLNAMQIRANNNVMANIQKEAYAQAEAAKKERLALEKQERIAKIKEYAGYVQMVGGLTTTTGMLVEKIGTAIVSSGTAQLGAGTELMTQGVAAFSAATGLTSSGTVQITVGGAQISIGTTQVGAGLVSVTVGGATEAAGITTQTVGAALIGTGTAMLSNPFTAAAGAALVTSGSTTVGSGTGTEISGATLLGSGTSQVSTGTVTTVNGTATNATGTASVLKGTATAAEATTAMASGIAQISSGAASIVSGTATIATGGVIQTIGTIVTAAGAATSAGADIANGNILGGIASIVGAAASVVGAAVPVSQLGNAAIQLGSQGLTLAGQLTTANAGQDNNNNDQDQKKKKKFKENARTQGIIKKTQNRKQAVANRFNK